MISYFVRPLFAVGYGPTNTSVAVGSLSATHLRLSICRILRCLLRTVKKPDGSGLHVGFDFAICRQGEPECRSTLDVIESLDAPPMSLHN